MIIGKVSNDTLARILILRASIANLQIKMVELKGNVQEFNTYVEQHVDALAGHGQVVDELIMHLFTAYETVADIPFSRYIENYRNEFEDGRRSLSADELMHLACQKYDLITQNDTYKSVNETDANVVALPAQVQGKPKQPRVYNEADFARKKVPPAKGEPDSKRHGKMKYNWCLKHMLWTLHTTEQCKLDPTTTSAGEQVALEKKVSEQEKLVLAKAMRAIVDSSDDDEE